MGKQEKQSNDNKTNQDNDNLKRQLETLRALNVKLTSQLKESRIENKELKTNLQKAQQDQKPNQNKKKSGKRKYNALQKSEDSSSSPSKEDAAKIKKLEKRVAEIQES